ncbi:hypothetical protein M2139_000515 [Enterococcus sp. PF1-24]|uniref:hypothetical protein n=1 Tax=unclassified Enterococcus TaxID=2608891 RepID=UPI002475751B|nr:MULTISPECIES: hypothetical protein [unclassified Enterococcus]MDH6363678.1 hypothetical protein [Enterococcus sp. PFB1-1]MDH6400634.1 hypothetical protein [Enterococcus sp. PF1-24]
MLDCFFPKIFSTDFNKKVEQDKLIEYTEVDKVYHRLDCGFDYLVTTCKNYEENRIAFVQKVFSGQDSIYFRNVDGSQLEWQPLSIMCKKDIKSNEKNPFVKETEYYIKVQLKNKFTEKEETVILKDSIVHGNIILADQVIVNTESIKAIDAILSQQEIQSHKSLKNDLLEIKQMIVANNVDKSEVSRVIEDLNNVTGLTTNLYTLVPPLVGWLTKFLVK